MGKSIKSQETKCPTCGREFSTSKGMKLHHVQIHGESLAGILVFCDWCGKEYRENATRAREMKHHFCCTEHYGKWSSENRTGKNAANYKGGKIEVVCAWCGEKKKMYPNQVNRSEHYFCDSTCLSKWRSEHVKGKNHPNYTKKPVACANCGNTLYRAKWKLERSDNHFCDRDCEAEWQSRYVRGENHPSWKGGKVTVTCDYCGKEKELTRGKAERGEYNFCDHNCYGAWLTEHKTGQNHPNWKGGYEPYYGPNWLSQRRKVLERDHYQCQICEMTRTESLERFESDLEVHHVIPIRIFDSYEVANNLANLVTLCKSCHTKIEHINIWRLLVALMLIKLRRNK